MRAFSSLLLHVIQYNIVQSLLDHRNLQYLQLLLRFIEVNFHLSLAIAHLLLKTDCCFLDYVGCLHHFVLLEHLDVLNMAKLTVCHEDTANSLKSVVIHQGQLDHFVTSPKAKWLFEQLVLFFCRRVDFILIFVIY